MPERKAGDADICVVAVYYDREREWTFAEWPHQIEAARSRFLKNRVLVVDYFRFSTEGRDNAAFEHRKPVYDGTKRFYGTRT